MSAISNPILDIDDGPDELIDAKPCTCGSSCIFIRANSPRNRTDSSVFRCANAHCGREVFTRGNDRAQAVAEWNQSVREDECEKHSYMKDESGDGWHCPHCGGKDFYL